MQAEFLLHLLSYFPGCSACLYHPSLYSHQGPEGSCYSLLHCVLLEAGFAAEIFCHVTLLTWCQKFYLLTYLFVYLSIY